MQKGFAPILIVILIVVIVVAIGGYIHFKWADNYSKNQLSHSLPTDTSFNPSSNTNPTATWKTYTNNSYNFSFKYPHDDYWPDLPQNESSDKPIVKSLYNKKLDYNRNWSDSTKPYQLAADNENFFTLEVQKKDEPSPTSLFPPKCEGFDMNKKITVNGYGGLYEEKPVIQGGGPGYSKIICVEKGDFDYMFFTQYTADSPTENKNSTIELFNQVLSTFKFIQ